MKTAAVQDVTDESPEPAFSVVPKPQYSDDWELAADGIYRYKPNGMYYWRPLLPNGKRPRRSLKTTNLKIAKER